MSTTSGPEKRSKILIVAITRLGDMLQATPTIIGLKEQYPDCRITVAIEKNFAAICEGIPGIDEVYPIDLALVCQCLVRERDGIVDAYRYVTEVIDELRKREFDYCLNMASSAYTALMLKMVNAKENRGWISDEEGFRLISNPWAMLFAAFVFHSNRDYNSLNLVDILRCTAGVTPHPLSLKYAIPERDRDFADKFLADSGIAGKGPLIGIQAGASQEKRQWATARFARLARLLIEKLDARLIFSGSRSEAPIIDSIFREYQHPNMLNVVGRTNLGQLASLLQKSDLLVTGDTGPMHLAVAVGTPVVALFLASALCFETGPYSAGNIVVQTQISCSPCNPNLPCARPDCHAQMSPELIFELVKLRLETPTEKLRSVVLPRTLVDPNDVQIYATVFDEHGFLDFQTLNGFGIKKALPGAYFRAAQNAYRWLWKSEFGVIPRESTDLLRDAARAAIPDVPGIKQILAYCDRGQGLLQELVRLVRDRRSTAAALGEVNQALIKLDRQIEEEGLQNPLVGAIMRMFMMEKENLRGDDALILASETKRLYDNLAYRCRVFGGLFAHFSSSIGER